MRLQGKVALISGAAQGMGAAEACLFAREGAAVGIADVQIDKCRRLEAEIAELGGEATSLQLDVTNESDWSSAVDTIVARLGKLDVLVNNAGIFLRARVEETTAEGWDRVMEVNAKGVFLGARAAIPAMREVGGGSIINISSTNGLVGTRVSAAYNASKAAAHILTKSIAVQYGRDGIRANSVHPGPIDTAMLDVAIPDGEAREERVSDIPLGRIGTPEEVAYGVSFPGLR